MSDSGEEGEMSSGEQEVEKISVEAVSDAEEEAEQEGSGDGSKKGDVEEEELDGDGQEVAFGESDEEGEIKDAIPRDLRDEIEAKRVERTLRRGGQERAEREGSGGSFGSSGAFSSGSRGGRGGGAGPGDVGLTRETVRREALHKRAVEGASGGFELRRGIEMEGGELRRRVESPRGGGHHLMRGGMGHMDRGGRGTPPVVQDLRDMRGGDRRGASPPPRRLPSPPGVRRGFPEDMPPPPRGDMPSSRGGHGSLARGDLRGELARGDGRGEMMDGQHGIDRFRGPPHEMDRRDGPGMRGGRGGGDMAHRGMRGGSPPMRGGSPPMRGGSSPGMRRGSFGQERGGPDIGPDRGGERGGRRD
ncbi:hypothetical protein T484DRAFT_1825605, partial [Baffinella frigidus]